MRPSRAIALAACVLVCFSCKRPSGSSTGGATPSAPSGVPGPAPAPLHELALNLTTGGFRGPSASYELTPERMLIYRQGDETTRVKVSTRELAPLDALLQSRDFADALKPARAEIGDVDTFRLKVTSTTLRANVDGYLLDAPEYTTPPAIRSLIADLDKLRALASAPRASTFDVTFRYIEQGGTAGKVEIFEVRSDGSVERRDSSTVLQRGTVNRNELGALARMLVSPELTALGPAFHDPTPPPSMMQQDYLIEIDKTAKLEGVIHDKTPAIVIALMAELRGLAAHIPPTPTP